MVDKLDQSFDIKAELVRTALRGKNLQFGTSTTEEEYRLALRDAYLDDVSEEELHDIFTSVCRHIYEAAWCTDALPLAASRSSPRRVGGAQEQ